MKRGDATATKKSRSTPSIETRAQQLLEQARLLSGATTDWMEVFNGVFGTGAWFSRLFPTEPERLAFSATPQRKEVFELLHQLRQKSGDREAPMAEEDVPASGSFRLRLPSALHAALVAEAKQQGVSLNQLCLTKLAVQLNEAVRQRAG
jgi:predicted HicB family RNase H-like nuclease